MNAALTDYNRAAEVVGFTRCAALSDARARLLKRRLLDLGAGDLDAGCHRFRDALSAIPHWPFLAGKQKASDGRKPFRLDLDSLLSTNSRMGDVLAKLCDLHEEHGPAATSVPQRANATWSEAQAEELADQQARYFGADHEGDHDALH